MNKAAGWVLVSAAVFAQAVALAKASPLRKPSSVTSATCRIGTETAGADTGYFVLVGGVREDSGVWTERLHVLERLATLQEQGVCSARNSVLPLDCAVASETKAGVTAYFISLDGSREAANTGDTGVWLQGRAGADRFLAGLQKKGVCRR